LKGIY